MRKTKIYRLLPVALLFSQQFVLAEDEDGNKHEIYGEVDFRVIERKDVDLDAFVGGAQLGTKGTYKLEKFDNLKSRWQIEFDLPVNSSLATDGTDNGDVALRKAQINLQGDFGEFIFGRQNHLINDNKKIDSFKNGSGAFLLAPGRLGNAISYVTPTFSGLHAYGQVIADVFTEETTDPATGETSTGEQSDDVDATTFGVDYSTDNFYLGVSRFDVNEFYSGEIELTTLGFSATFGDFSVFGTYQDEGFDDYQTAGLGVSYSVNDWKFSVGHLAFDDAANLAEESADTEGGVSHFLVTYNLRDNVSTFVQYVDYDSDAEENGFGGDAISIGITAQLSKVFSY